MHTSPIKILVAYHKPAKLLQDDIFVPVHCGRELGIVRHKDGHMSEHDYAWLMQNTIGDNVGNNISMLNRHVNEMSAVYSAWKNYDVFGNPSYIGLCHYRRVFAKSDIADYQDYDIIAPTLIFAKNIVEQFALSHHVDCLSDILEKVRKIDGYEHVVHEQLHQDKGFFFNIFLMKKEIFFEYCEFIFPLLFELHDKLNYSELSYYGQRMPAFVAERLTSIFISKKISDGCRVKQVSLELNDSPPCMKISKVFDKNTVPVVFSLDAKSATYLAVTLQSLIAHTSTEFNYDICIVNNNLPEHVKTSFQDYATNNISIRFIDFDSIVDKYKIVECIHADNILKYFQFFIPELFAEYEKVIYLDDAVLLFEDIAKLYNTNLGDYPLAAAKDMRMLRKIFIKSSKNFKLLNYIQHSLKLSDRYSYFQNGVLILNNSKLVDANFTQQCLSKLQSMGNNKATAQDILNAVLDNNICILDVKWNVAWNLQNEATFLMNELPNDEYIAYLNAIYHPCLMHFAGAVKPWQKPQLEFANLWWQHARKSIFYEEIIYENTLGTKKFNFFSSFDIKSFLRKLLLQDNTMGHCLRVAYRAIRNVLIKLQNFRTKI